MARETVVTIGMFDGVHRGHQAVIRKAIESAKAARLTTVAVTFDRLPSGVVRGSEPALLTTMDEKIRLLKKLGVDQVLVFEFNDKFARLSAGEFIEKVLAPLNPGYVVVGEEFRFGRARGGDVDLLKEYGAGRGWEVLVQPLLALDGKKVSSSAIRSALKAGRVEDARIMLGRRPTFPGLVVEGTGRGRGLGFPTANIEVEPDVLMPRTGVYAGYLRHARSFKACTINWGYAPTFGDRRKPVFEAHCLEGATDLRGKHVEVELEVRLRDEKTFPDRGSLVQQLRADAHKARDMLR